MKILFSFLSFLILLSCDNEPDSDLITWQKNWNKWESMNMTHYVYNFRASCYCIDEWVRGASVTVNNDSVISLLFTDDGKPPQILQISDWHTINSLFDLSKTIIEEADKFKLEYDKTYGNPTLISVDWNSQAIDDEVIFYINNVQIR